MKVDKDQISAWGVHAFTGSGAILGFLALVSILNNDQVGSFLWLGMALLVDGVDGSLARRVGVEEKAPNLDGIILNAAAYTHTSVGIADAVKGIETPVIEVHISNVHSREDFRHVSYIAPNAKGVITGFGLQSYELAIQSFL